VWHPATGSKDKGKNCNANHVLRVKNTLFSIVNKERIALLEEYVRQDPQDPFNHYALALEYLHAHPSEALGRLQKVIEQFPHYLPSYYPCAELTAMLGSAAAALTVAESGMTKALQAGDRKTASELRTLAESIQD